MSKLEGKFFELFPGKVGEVSSGLGFEIFLVYCFKTFLFLPERISILSFGFGELLNCFPYSKSLDK